MDDAENAVKGNKNPDLLMCGKLLTKSGLFSLGSEITQKYSRTCLLKKKKKSRLQ